MVAVAYRRWSFSRGSNCKALTGKVLVFWLRDRLRELVAHGSSLVSCGQRADCYIKKERFQKYPDTCGRGLSISQNSPVSN